MQGYVIMCVCVCVCVCVCICLNNAVMLAEKIGLLRPENTTSAYIRWAICADDRCSILVEFKVSHIIFSYVPTSPRNNRWVSRIDLNNTSKHYYTEGAERTPPLPILFRPAANAPVGELLLYRHTSSTAPGLNWKEKENGGWIQC